ncbi:MAG: M20/M25/M40 family metallo-hydrolase [Actinomycetota bacterium]
MASDLTSQTVELLQTMIRNACVNDGTPESGQEIRNVDTLTSFLEGAGLDVQRYEPALGRTSLVSRIEGTDPDAPSLCLMGHTDVVPVNESGWSRDPFGGELIDDEVWGRGAVDMLNLTASMAVAFRHLKTSGFRPRGDLIYFAVADEESGSQHGAQWMADNHADDIRADYVLTENGGLHSDPSGRGAVGVSVGEKGVAWRRLRLRGEPGHGSMPFRANNALLKAAAVAQRLGDYRPPPRFSELWTERVASLDLDPESTAILLDPDRIDEALAEMPNKGSAAYLHACTHTTFSVNLVDGGMMKTNIIPDDVELHVDIRTLPGDETEEVQAHLDTALGDLADEVDVEIIMNDPASISRTDTPLWESLQRAVERPFPGSRLSPQMTVGFTDARVFRALGSVAYGAGLFSPELNAGDFSSRFHGNDERIDVESLALTTGLWTDVSRDLLG